MIVGCVLYCTESLRVQVMSSCPVPHRIRPAIIRIRVVMQIDFVINTPRETACSSSVSVSGILTADRSCPGYSREVFISLTAVLQT